MTAIQYLKARNRICYTYINTKRFLCPFYKHTQLDDYTERCTACERLEYSDPKRAIQIVQNWCKEHPVKE